MQEQLTTQKTGKGNKVKVRRTVDVLAVETTLIIEKEHGSKKERKERKK